MTLGKELMLETSILTSASDLAWQIHTRGRKNEFDKLCKESLK